MTFRAIYLSEIDHFSFVLIGEHIKKSTKPSFNNLYDDITGLPNFFLFEDRVQVAISLENAKEDARDQNMIAVISVNIDNIETFRKMHIEDTVVKKVANNLVLNLPKNATVALGLKYHFWIMLPGLRNRMDVNREIRHIYELLNEGVSDNFTRHELLFSIGASSFPNPGHSTKKVIEQAISAVKNYGLGLDQRIATSLGYKEFHDPDYGTTSATKNEDGSWSVTIKGSMFGYVDEYHSQLENYKFDVSATVTEDGEVTVRVSKVN
jgi:GGDEF domain-containing protein